MLISMMAEVLRSLTLFVPAVIGYRSPGNLEREKTHKKNKREPSHRRSLAVFLASGQCCCHGNIAWLA